MTIVPNTIPPSFVRGMIVTDQRLDALEHGLRRTVSGEFTVDPSTTWSDNSIPGTALQDGTVAGPKIGTGQIGTGHIGTGAINSGHIAALSIATGHLQADSITSTHITAGTILASDVQTGTLTADRIATNTLTATQIATDAITADEIATGTITANEVLANTLTANEIAANAITASELAANSITAGDMLANTITAGQIAATTITAGQIAANTITASQVAADTLTANEIAANAITASELAANSITAADMLANTITAGQIAASTITASQIAADTITAGQIAADAITTSEIASGTILTGDISSGTIQGSNILANTLTGNLIAANTIAGDRMIANTITANEIAAGAITTNELLATAIDGMTITGAIVRTSASNPRAEISSTGIRLINTGGVVTFHADTATGKVISLAGIGGGNMLRQTAPTGVDVTVVRRWSSSNPDPPVVETTLKFGDYNTWKHTSNGVGIGVIFNDYTSDNIVLAGAGEDWVASGYFYTSVASRFMRIRIIPYDAANASIAGQIDTGWQAIPVDTWTRLSTPKWTTPALTTKLRVLYDFASTSGGGTPTNGDIWYIGGPQLERGVLPTSYTRKVEEILANEVGSVEVAPGSIDGGSVGAGSHIAAGTIVGGDIALNTITANKIGTGQLDAFLITGGNIQTAAANPKISITSAGIIARDAAGNITFAADGTTGKITTLAGIGGPNLIFNSSFEKVTPTGILPLGMALSTDLSPTAVLDVLSTTDTKHGGRIARLTNSTDTTGYMGVGTPTANKISVEAGKSYVLSGWYKGSATAANFWVQINFYNAADVLQGSVIASPEIAGSTSTWTRNSVTGVAPATTTNARVYIYVRNPASGSVHYVDAMQFEEGTIPTAYSPHPDELSPDTVTAVELENTLANASLTSFRHDFSDVSRWKRNAGSGTFTSEDVTDSEFGGKVGRAVGYVWNEWPDNIPFDPDKLYRVTVTVRMTVDDATTNDIFYAGFSGIGADGVSYVNTSGANSSSSQHYTAASGYDMDNAGLNVWKTFTSYFKGHAATGTVGEQPDPLAPRKMHTNVRYLRPIFIANFSGGTGTMELSSFTMDVVETPPNSILGGAPGALGVPHIRPGTVQGNVDIAALSIDAGQINAGAITTAKLFAGAVTADKITLKVGGTNLLAGRNPSFEDGTTTNWVGSTGVSGIVADNAITAAFGTWSCKATCNAAATYGQMVLSTYIPIHPTEVHSASAWMRTTVGSRNGHMVVVWYDAASTALRTDVSLGTPLNASGQWTQVQYPNIPLPPATATKALVYARCQATSGSPTNGEFFWVDGIMLEEGETCSAFTMIGPDPLLSTQIGAGQIKTGNIDVGAVKAANISVEFGGGSNLLINSSFDDVVNPLSGWNLYNSNLTPAPVLDTTITANAKYIPVGQTTSTVARITNGTDVAGALGLVINSANRIPVQPGFPYTMSGWCKVFTGGAQTFNVHIHWYDSGGVLIGGGNTSVAVTGSTGEFRRAEVSAVAPAGAVKAAPYIWVNNPASGGVYWFDALQFEEGEYASSYKDNYRDPNTITGTHIAPDQIDTPHLKTNAVTANKINVIWGGQNLHQNASFEDTTLSTTASATPPPGYRAITNGTFKRVTTPVLFGTNACALSRVTSAGTAELASSNTARVTAAPGDIFTVSAYFRSAAVARSARMFMTWVDAGGTGVGTATGTSITTTTTGWVRATLTATAPASTATLQTHAQVLSVAIAEEHYVDGLQVERGETVTAFNPLVNELLPDTVGTTQIAPDSITTSELAADSITAKHTITGAVIRTSASNPRIEMNSTQFAKYDSGGTATVRITPADGLDFAAASSGSPPNDRTIRWLTSTGFPTAKVYAWSDPASGGTDYQFIYNEADWNLTSGSRGAYQEVSARSGLSDVARLTNRGGSLDTSVRSELEAIWHTGGYNSLLKVESSALEGRIVLRAGTWEGLKINVLDQGANPPYYKMESGLGGSVRLIHDSNSISDFRLRWAPVSVRVRNNAAISVANNTATVLTFNTDVWDQYRTGVSTTLLEPYPPTGAHGTATGSIGTVSKTAGSSTLTGTSTTWTAIMRVGDVISVPGTANEVRVVVAVNSDTSLTVNSNFANTAASQNATRVNTALVALEEGEYDIYGHVEWAANSQGQRQIAILRNGTNLIAVDSRSPLNGVETRQSISTSFRLAKWDYVELRAFQDSGSSVNINAATDYSPQFGMIWRSSYN